MWKVKMARANEQEDEEVDELDGGVDFSMQEQKVEANIEVAEYFRTPLQTAFDDNKDRGTHSGQDESTLGSSKQDDRELSDIHSSMTTLLNVVRVQRQALEVAEMRLIGLLTESQKKLGEIGIWISLDQFRFPECAVIATEANDLEPKI
ncbi:hypothetical protein R1sor_008106 [Riccia sorocarpa]|uniref:Uncharacterized protein n=1 Tax=Riccia sorocarpa TaxID=122646 RepID=A0ABD3HSD7_9MARC